MKFQNILKIKVNILLFYLFLIFSLSSCDALFAPTEEESTSAGAYTEEGIASYYAINTKEDQQQVEKHLDKIY